MSMTFNARTGSAKEKGYPCDLCGSTAVQIIWDKVLREELGVLNSAVVKDADGNMIHGRIVMCEKCGLIYTDPKLTELDLIKFYQEEYREIYNTGNNLMAHMQSEANHANTAFQIMQRYIDVEALNQSETDVLKYADIGASTLRACTGFKAVFKDKAKVIAIEPSKEYIEAGLELNKKNNMDVQIEIFNGMINSFNPPYKLDFVTMLNTLEHMHSPSKALQHIYSIMDEGGILVISVPTLFGISQMLSIDAWFSNAHLFHFVPPTISMLLVKTGFQPIEMIGQMEEIGEKMYIVAQKTQPQDIVIDKTPNYGLVRQYLLEQDAVNLTRFAMINGGYYK